MCVAMMAALYREILAGIEARDHDVFGDRVALSTGRKVALMGRETFSSLSLR